jgi:hypothetical protein
MPTNHQPIVCYACKRTLERNGGEKIHKNEECSYCYADLHCCRMCEFYDPKAYNQCREPNAERIVEKEKANYCDYFILKGGEGNQGSQKDDLFSAADSLFKN